MSWLDGKTLDDVLAQTPMDIAVMKTADNTYVSDRLGASLHPIVGPNGTVMNVPWDPQDADLGAIAGGVLQYGALSAIEWGLDRGRRLADWAQSRGMSIGFNNPARRNALQ